MARLTAQSRYIEMLNGFISPTLRESGWKGSRGRYERAMEGLTEEITFQKSRYSTPQTVQFRVWVVRRTAEGELVEPDEFEPDRWWIMSVEPEFDPEAVVDEVLAHIARLTA